MIKITPFVLLFAVTILFCNNPVNHENEAIEISSCSQFDDSTYTNLEIRQNGILSDPCYSSVDTINLKFSLVREDTMNIKLLTNDGDLIRNIIENKPIMPGIHSVIFYSGDLNGIIGISTKSRNIVSDIWIKIE